jgi:hypothetical protein
VLAALMFHEHHGRPFVLGAVRAALSTRHPIFRLYRTASSEGAPGRRNIDQVFFMNRAPRSALAWRSKGGLLTAPRPIAQLVFHVHHGVRFMLDTKDSTR